VPDSVVIVTGGAGGIGRVTAELLGRDHAVVISGRTQGSLDSAVTELSARGITATAVVADVADRAAVDALFAKAGALGRVAAVVHAAGVSPQMGPADSMIAINALGTVHVTQAALAAAGEGFALVNVSSVAGHLLPALFVPRRAYRLALTDPAAFAARLARVARRAPRGQRSAAAYTLSKNFVIWYSAKMAAAFGARGARILSVSPGVFDTPMGRLEERHGAAAIIRHSALNRLGDPREVAELLAFCASAKPGYLTGTDILCDGGTMAGSTVRALVAQGRRALADDA
jgi:NAD(P)-dependent dehydrogenase (short-subunit alcohol dehydrogenase family)